MKNSAGTGHFRASDKTLITVAAPAGGVASGDGVVIGARFGVATIQPTAAGTFEARNLPDDEIAEHQQAKESAAHALRTWRDQLQSGKAAEDAPQQPEAPQA